MKRQWDIEELIEHFTLVGDDLDALANTTNWSYSREALRSCSNASSMKDAFLPLNTTFLSLLSIMSPIN
jgi:hypothetical protein